MRPRRGLTEADRALWQAFAVHITPSAGRALPPPPPPPPEPPPPAPVATVAPPVPPSALVKPAPPKPPPPLAPGRHVGVDAGTARRLSRGEMTVDARLDLHGMTQEAAHLVLNRFITNAQARGQRCVLVITGKGGRDGPGILRHMLPRWLNEPALRSRVVTMDEARPRHGGGGAFYLLLRRLRD